MNRESWINEILSDLRENNLDRHLECRAATGGKFSDGRRTILNFSSNDYLDLAHHPAVIAAAHVALAQHGGGATASRLVAGTLSIHEELEKRLATFKRYPAALLFGSGYLTNAGVIPVLVGREDTVYTDRLVHASVIDAITLSRARLVRFHHNDVQHLSDVMAKDGSGGRKLIVTESLFSMNGDLAPLPELAALSEKHGAMLMVDEAHATGVFGPDGRGLICRHGLESIVNVSMGTLSKALGGYGGFVACSNELKELLVNRSRAFIYTTAPPPSVVGAALGALDVIEKNPGLGEQLLQRAGLFRGYLSAAGLDTMKSESQIIPILVGDNAKALSLAKRLREQGILIVAIRPPTVPEGTARLRLSITLAHTEEDLKYAAGAIATAAKAEGLI